MSEPSAPVLHERRDSVCWITINRPDRRTAINADVIAGIREGLAAFNVRRKPVWTGR